jgi:hypothetical protein
MPSNRHLMREGRRYMLLDRLLKLQIASYVAIAVFMSYKLATIGFNPSDDGFILAQSKRILDGDIPHRDFLSPRPAGSPLLHSFELFLPTPQIITSRIIVFVQLMFTSLMLCYLLCRQTFLWKMKEIRLLLIIIVMTLSTHQFPLMPWHTIDGIMVFVVGIGLIDRSKNSSNPMLLPIAGLIIGFTPVIKQSFAPALLVGAVLMLFCSNRTYSHRILSITTLTMPSAMYVTWISVNDGIASMTQQMFGSPLPRTFYAWSETNVTVIIIFVCSCVFALTKSLNTTRTFIYRVVNILLSISIAISSVYWVSVGQLQLTNWSTPLLFLSLAAILLQSNSLSDFFGIHSAIVVLGVMVSLSWGYPNSNLIAGGLWMITLLPLSSLLLKSNFKQTTSLNFRFLSVLATWVTSLLLVFVLYESRSNAVYRDVPFSEQISLSGLSPELRGINGNKLILNVINDVKNCLERYPAELLAVLPDAAIFPLLFEKRNPLNIDWWTPSELTVLPSSFFNENMKSTNHLILFQSVTMDVIANLPEIPTAVDSVSIASYGNDLMQKLFIQLPGDTVSCGSLIGKHQS